MGIGQRIRTVRESKDIGLRELARAMGISPGALSKIETDEDRSPEFANIEKAANALHVTLDFLATGQGRELPPVPPSVVVEYVRSRFREMRRQNVRITEIARRCAIDVSQVRRIWNVGHSLGDVNGPPVARGLGFADMTELTIAAREWWRATGRAIISASHKDEDPIPARAEANADIRRGFAMIDQDFLDALETNVGRENEPYSYWRDAFLASQKRRIDAERADESVIIATREKQKQLALEMDAATTDAARKLARKRGTDATPEPPSTATAPRSRRGKRKAVG